MASCESSFPINRKAPRPHDYAPPAYMSRREKRLLEESKALTQQIVCGVPVEEQPLFLVSAVENGMKKIATVFQRRHGR